MDNFTYTRHRKLVCCGKWRISGEFVRRNSPALVYHNPLVGGPNPSAATRISRCSGIFYFVKIFRFCPNLSVLADVFTYTGHNSGHRKYRPNGRWGLSCVLLFFVKCRQDFCGIMMHMLLDGTK